MVSRRQRKVTTTMAPPIRCTPCRVRFNGTRYAVSADGTVRPILLAEAGVGANGAFLGTTVYTYGPALDAAGAKAVRQEAARLRRNRNARERADACRSLGLTRAGNEWE